MSENATGADNQQERLQHIPEELGHYLAGFADGEGSFNISIIRRPSDYRNGWKLVASFNVTQHDSTIPKLFQETLRCGTIRFRKDGICYFEVRKISDINEVVREFFSRFPLRSNRQSQRLQLLLDAMTIIARGEHLTPKGLQKVLLIRESMITNRQRKFKMTDVMQNPQRLYAKLT
jgi:hypothetical protein